MPQSFVRLSGSDSYRNEAHSNRLKKLISELNERISTTLNVTIRQALVFEKVFLNIRQTLNYPIILVGSTHSLNCSSVTNPSAMAASRRVVPS